MRLSSPLHKVFEGNNPAFKAWKPPSKKGACREETRSTRYVEPRTVAVSDTTIRDSQKKRSWQKEA